MPQSRYGFTVARSFVTHRSGLCRVLTVKTSSNPRISAAWRAEHRVAAMREHFPARFAVWFVGPLQC